MKKNLLSLILLVLAIPNVFADQHIIRLLNQSKYLVRVEKVGNDGMEITNLKPLAPGNEAVIRYHASKPSANAFYLYFYQKTPVLGFNFYYDSAKKKEMLTVMPYANTKIGIYYDLIRKTVTINNKH